MDADALETLERLYAFIDAMTCDDTRTVVADRRELRRIARSYITRQCHQQAITDAARIAALEPERT